MNLWQPRWLLIGDSIQAWVVDDTVSNPANPSNLTAVRIASQYNAATIQNLSCPGAQMAGANGLGNYPDDVQHQIGPFGINGIIITLGTNDLSDPNITVAQFQAKYAAYVAALRTMTTAPIVLVSPLNRFDTTTFPLGKTMAQMRAAVEAVKQGAGAGVYHINPSDWEHGTNQWLADGLHLNNGGHWLFSTYLYNKIHALGLW